MENTPAKTDAKMEIQNDFMAMIERLATDPNCDVSKLEKMMDLQNRVLDRNAAQAFNADMVVAQAEIKTIAHDKRNRQTNSDYAKLDSIIKEAKPIYTRHGFALSFYEGDTDKEDHVRTCVDVMHREGHTISRFCDFHIDNKGIKGSPTKTKIHGEASCFSYGRRYLTCMVFNIPTGDDDDGNASGGVQYISPEQQSEIQNMVDTIYSPKQHIFWEYMEVESVDQIKAIDYKKAKTALSKAKKHRTKK